MDHRFIDFVLKQELIPNQAVLFEKLNLQRIDIDKDSPRMLTTLGMGVPTTVIVGLLWESKEAYVSLAREWFPPPNPIKFGTLRERLKLDYTVDESNDTLNIDGQIWINDQTFEWPPELHSTGSYGCIPQERYFPAESESSSQLKITGSCFPNIQIDNNTIIVYDDSKQHKYLYDVFRITSTFVGHVYSLVQRAKLERVRFNRTIKPEGKESAVLPELSDDLKAINSIRNQFIHEGMIEIGVNEDLRAFEVTWKRDRSEVEGPATLTRDLSTLIESGFQAACTWVNDTYQSIVNSLD